MTAPAPSLFGLGLGTFSREHLELALLFSLGGTRVPLLRAFSSKLDTLGRVLQESMPVAANMTSETLAEDASLVHRVGAAVGGVGWGVLGSEHGPSRPPSELVLMVDVAFHKDGNTFCTNLFLTLKELSTPISRNLGVLEKACIL